MTAQLLGAAVGAGAVRGHCLGHLVFWGAVLHRGPDDFIQGEPASPCGGPRTLVPLSGEVLGGSDALPVFSSCGFCPPSLPLLPDTSLLPRTRSVLSPEVRLRTVETGRGHVPPMFTLRMGGLGGFWASPMQMLHPSTDCLTGRLVLRPPVPPACLEGQGLLPVSLTRGSPGAPAPAGL